MISFVYNGKKYIRYNDEWVNDHYEIAPLAVKAVLDTMYADSLNLEEYSVDDLVSTADSFKKNESYYLAARFYQEAIERADIGQCRYIS